MRGLINSIKWTPVIITLAMIIAFIFALCSNSIIEHISPKFGYSMICLWPLWIGSRVMKFCLWHRILIVNLFVIMLLVNINNDIMLIPFLWNIRFILLISTVSLLVSTFLYFKYGCFTSSSSKGNFND